MSENTASQSVVHNQGVYSHIFLPINDDHIAVSYAIRDLIKEGWRHQGIIKRKEGIVPTDNFYIELSREWTF